VEPRRRHPNPYREPSPPEKELAVLTCDEMRCSTGTTNALLLVIAACAIAWVIVGR
jgi:hypothetical protein